MAAERQVLKEALLNQVHHSSAPHYRNAELEPLRRRCGTLVDKFLEAVAGSPASFVEYVTGIAGARYDEGFGLDEIQMALNIFEEYAWKVCAHKVEDKEQLLKDLSLVTGIFGTAKDQLAREYLKQKDNVLSVARVFIEQVEELTGGMETTAIPVS